MGRGRVRRDQHCPSPLFFVGVPLYQKHLETISADYRLWGTTLSHAAAWPM